MSSRAPPPPTPATPMRPRSKPTSASKHALLPHGRPHGQPGSRVVRHHRRESSVFVVDSFSHPVVVCPTTSHFVESRLIYNLGDPVISHQSYTCMQLVPSLASLSNVRENRLVFDSWAGFSLFGQCFSVGPAGPASPWPTVHARCTGRPCSHVGS